MALFDYKNNSLYPDRYKRPSNWIRVLPIHGRPLQTAELIEMQSILHDNMKQGFDTLFKNGSVLFGLDVSIFSQTRENMSLSISNGSMYVEGLVIDVPATSLSVPTTGTYTIGVSINESIITEKEDPTLRDPIKGSFVYGLEGASRLVWNPIIEVNNPNSFTIARVVDGGIIKVTSSGFTSFERLLSQYTFERNGNYCVKGFEVSQIDSTSLTVSDRERYSDISEAVKVARDDAQATLTEALGAQTRFTNLLESLNSAIARAEQSPTTQNSLVVADLTNKLSEAESFYSDKARLVIVKQANLTTAEAELSRSQDLLIDKISLLVSPGVAYVEGKRVSLSSSALINIPKDLSVVNVDSASFTYSGRTASNIRVFSGTTTSAVSSNLILNISFNKIIYQSQFAQIDIDVELGDTSVTNISSLIDFLVQEFNSVGNIHSSVTFSSPTLSLGGTNLRSILKNNLTVTEYDSVSLLFESTSISDEANQIEITITPVGAIAVDIESSALGGAGRSSSFQLGFRPVDQIVKIVAELQQNYLPITRGSVSGTSDNLGDDTVITITKVIQGSTEYLQGRDFQLINQSQIDWSLNVDNSIEPAVGTTYYVSFVYTQLLVKDKDFVLDREGDFIRFIGKTPAPNKTFTVDYTYFLSRSGVVTLSSNGELSYILGDSSPNPITPSVPSTLLPLVRFDMFANSTVLYPIECAALSFSTIRSLINEVRGNARAIKALSLENEIYEIAAGVVGDDLVGISSDSLQDLSGTDIYHPDFNASIVPATNSITVGYSYKDVSLRLQSHTNSVMTQDHLGRNEVIILSYTESPFISQERSSREIEITEKEPLGRGHLFVSPSLLFRNDSSTVSKFSPCDVLSQRTSLLSRLSPSSNTSPLLNRVSQSSKSLFRIPAEKLTSSLRDGNSVLIYESFPDSILNEVSSNVKVAPVEVRLKVTNLPPNTDGFKIYFSGRLILISTPLTGTNNSVSFPGGYLSNAQGEIGVRFNLPSNIECGTHTVEVKGPNGFSRARLTVFNNLLNHIVIGASYNWDQSPTDITSDSMLKLEYLDSSDQAFPQGTTSLLSPGVLPNVIVSQVTDAQIFPYLHDKVSQTFELPDFYFLTSVEVKFKNAPIRNINLFLREVDDLGPKRMSLAKSSTSSINGNSTSPTTWSKFTFNHPVSLKPGEYSFGLESTSSYSLYSAYVGEEDFLTEGLVGDQLYLRGDMYTSEDGRGLEVNLNEDLTYKLNVASFSETEAVINFGRYGIDDSFIAVTYFTLNTLIVSPSDTSIKFEYSLNQTNWYEFVPNVIVCLSVITNTIYLRAKMSTVNSLVSPVLLFRDSSVSLYSALPTSQYISKLATYLSPYKDVDIYFKYIKSNNTVINVYYSSADPEELILYSQEWYLASFDSEEFIDEGLGIVRAKYTVRNPSTNDAAGPRVNFRYKIELTNESSVQADSSLVFDVTSYVS